MSISIYTAIGEDVTERYDLDIPEEIRAFSRWLKQYWVETGARETCTEEDVVNIQNAALNQFGVVMDRTGMLSLVRKQ